MTQTPLPKRDSIEQVDESRSFAYDPADDRFVSLEVNDQGQLRITGTLNLDGSVTVGDTPLSEALGSVGDDHLLVGTDTPLDVSGATVTTDPQSPVGLEDSTGTQLDPATEGTLSSELSREIATWSAGVLSIQEDTALDVSAATVTTDLTDQSGRNLGKLRLMDSGEVLIDPATESTLTDVLNRLTTLRDRTSNGSGIYAGQDSVENAETTTALSSQIIPDDRAVVVQGLPGNGGTVYVGRDDTVDNTNGYPLAGGQTIGYHVQNVNNIYVYAANAGDGVAWTVEESN